MNNKKRLVTVNSDSTFPARPMVLQKSNASIWIGN